MAIALTLPPTESRVILLILGMPRPVSCWWIGKHLDLKYSHTKRAVRSLVAWKILQRSADGLVFQPDYRLWQPPSWMNGAGTRCGTNIGPSGAAGVQLDLLG
jgi:hypothetical protein